MKIIKRISLILAVALAVVCMGALASACNSATDFTITVYYSDGTTLVDGSTEKYGIQICYLDTDKNELVSCSTAEGLVGADGKATINIDAVEAEAPQSGNIKYEVHVLSVDGTEELKESVYVSRSNASVKVVLKNVNAPTK